MQACMHAVYMYMHVVRGCSYIWAHALVLGSHFTTGFSSGHHGDQIEVCSREVDPEGKRDQLVYPVLLMGSDKSLAHWSPHPVS